MPNLFFLIISASIAIAMSIGIIINAGNSGAVGDGEVVGSSVGVAVGIEEGFVVGDGVLVGLVAC